MAIKTTTQTQKNSNGSTTTLHRTVVAHPSVGDVRHKTLDALQRSNQSKG